MTNPEQQSTNKTESAHSAEDLEPTMDRDVAISDLHNLFSTATKLPLEELVPGYQDGKFATFDRVDPYVTRGENYPGYKNVTAFRTPAYPREKPGGATRAAVLLHDGRNSIEGAMVEMFTGKQVEGGIVDYDDKPWMNGIEVWPYQRYVFVRDGSNNLDVVKLPGFLVADDAEKRLLGRILNDRTSNDPLVTPELINEVVGNKIQPASREEIREIEDKIKQHIAAYPERIAKKMELSAATEAEIAHSKTLRGKLGKLARRATGKEA